MKKRVRRFAVGMLIFIAGICSVNAYAHDKVSGRAYTGQLNSGYQYLAAKDYEQAQVAFENIIELDEGNYKAYLGLAEVYYAMGEPENAEAVMEEIADKCSYGMLQMKVIEAEEGLRQFRNMANYNTGFEAVSGLTDFCMQGLDIFLDWIERASTVIDGVTRSWKSLCNLFT